MGKRIAEGRPRSWRSWTRRWRTRVPFAPLGKPRWRIRKACTNVPRSVDHFRRLSSTASTEVIGRRRGAPSPLWWTGWRAAVRATSMTSWDIRGKRVVVTGATSGIGLEAARSLAKQGANVVMIGRDPAKTARCLEEVRAAAPGAEISSLLCDFSRQADVRRLAEEILQRFDRLDVLVNNAGTVFAKRTLTDDGIEATFAVNHLGYFLLTRLLLDRIVQSAPARIVSVASIAHRRATMDFDDLFFERGYSVFQAYGRSKLANILYSRQL